MSVQRGKRMNNNEVFSHKNYLIRRNFFKQSRAVFHIYDSEGKLAFYSKVKAFKLKEDIRIFTGEDMKTEVLTIKARKILGFSSAYDVVDSSDNTKVGALKRKGFKYIFRDEWIIMDTDDREIGFIKEDSVFLSIIRRFLGSLISQKYHVELNGEKVCEFKQNFNPFIIKINLDFSIDEKGLLDRRLGIAAAILMCAIEQKQK